MHRTYEKLISDAYFTRNLGDMVLAVGRLEGVLTTYLAAKGVEIGSKIPLGGIIKKLQTSGNIDDTASFHLGFLLAERNYFIHKITSLMSGYEIENEDIRILSNRLKSVREEAEFFASAFCQRRRRQWRLEPSPMLTQEHYGDRRGAAFCAGGSSGAHGCCS